MALVSGKTEPEQKAGRFDAMKHELHEILLPVLVAVLVARPGHVLLGEEVVVGVLLLPLLLLPLLGDARLLLFLFCYSSDTRAPPDGDNEDWAYPGQPRGLFLLAQLPQVVVLLLLQVRVLLHPGLVEPVDDRVLPLRDEYPLDLSSFNVLDLKSRRAIIGTQAKVCRGRIRLPTFLLSLKPTWPTAMLPSFFRLDQGV